MSSCEELEQWCKDNNHLPPNYSTMCDLSRGTSDYGVKAGKFSVISGGSFSPDKQAKEECAKQCLVQIADNVTQQPGYEWFYEHMEETRKRMINYQVDDSTEEEMNYSCVIL